MKQNFYNERRAKTSAEALFEAKKQLYEQLQEFDEKQTEIKVPMHEFEFWDFKGQKFKLCLTIEKID